jgi:hypothetical protein
MRLMITWILRELEPELDFGELWIDEGRVILVGSRDLLSASENGLAEKTCLLSSAVIAEIVFSDK